MPGSVTTCRRPSTNSGRPPRAAHGRDVFDADSTQGHRLARTIGHRRLSEWAVRQQFQSRFGVLRRTIADRLTLGIDVRDGLKDPSMMFECGWAWDVVKDAPEVEGIGAGNGAQSDGVAEPMPHLYFTGVPLDGIQDLFSARTLTLGLLNEGEGRTCGFECARHPEGALTRLAGLVPAMASRPFSLLQGTCTVTI
ncbi:hypothetical protein ABT173_49225 [Streptomyces sp. NPDC001795]|uniref:hypothetical protein n=1 Tax=Streptomyces sp. NPDC001795 TaxID=3154525 RepID=UPI003325D591